VIKFTQIDQVPNNLLFVTFVLAEFAYCYFLVNVTTLSWSQSDHMKRLALYLGKFLFKDKEYCRLAKQQNRSLQSSFLQSSSKCWCQRHTSKCRSFPIPVFRQPRKKLIPFRFLLKSFELIQHQLQEENPESKC